MDILSLLLLYYLSQKDDFFESIKPLLGNIKSSENMLKFLNDLNRFSEMFNAFKNGSEPQKPDRPTTPLKDEPKKEPPPKKENSQSPISGIANEFIQQSLDAYFKKRS